MIFRFFTVVPKFSTRMLYFLVYFYFFNIIVKASESSINFLVIGDWGGIGSSPYYTDAQLSTANSMKKIGNSIAADFIVSLGDNFYFNGVSNIDDLRFENTWQNVYSPESKWYITIGEYDYKGNVTAQIAYSAINSLWVFPSEYHSHTFSSIDGSVVLDLLLIDTIDLAGTMSYVEGAENKAKFVSLSQWTWIEERLKQSSAQYLIVAGHYPIYSICENGPTKALITNLLPLLELYNAHYMSGHDHCMEFFKSNESLNYDVNQWIIGTGKECCNKATKINDPLIPSGTLQFYLSSDNNPLSTSGGFASFEATTSSLTVKFYDHLGNIIYRPSPVLPRASITNFPKNIILLGDSLMNRPYNEYDLSGIIESLIIPSDFNFSIINQGENANKIEDILNRMPTVMSFIQEDDFVLLFWDSDCSDVDETLLSKDEVVILRNNFMNNIQAVIDIIVKVTPFLAIAGPEILGEGLNAEAMQYTSCSRFLNSDGTTKENMLNDYRNMTRLVTEANGLNYIDIRQAFVDAIPPNWDICSTSVTKDGKFYMNLFIALHHGKLIFI